MVKFGHELFFGGGGEVMIMSSISGLFMNNSE